MRALGETFRLIVAGMADSLQARRDTKRAIKADDMTQFGAIGNNPLKLADMGVDSIVKLLLMSQGGTYLSMSEAIKEGFENLHSHQLGTMAGMRAALNSLLECFDPQQLEGELSQRSFLESIIPSARKAKYWDAYLQHYDVIAEQAEENFLDLIGDDLREQLAKVTRSKSETD
jgi:type VI secretion system FHA domain protein